MLIDINLLEKKERRSSHFLRLMLYVCVIFLLSLFLLSYQANKEEKKAERAEARIVETRALVAEAESKLADSQTGSSIAVLKEAILWAEREPIETVPVIEAFIKKLPERGFFKEFAYRSDGIVALEVQFDTSRQAAYYAHELTAIPWVLEASVLSVTIQELEEEEDALTLNEDVLPRFIATYELQLDKQLVKREQEEKRMEREGGDEDESSS